MIVRASLAEIRKTRNLLGALVGSACVVALLASLVFLMALRDAAIEDAGTRVTGSVRLLEEHIVRTFRATHSILGRAAALANGRTMDALATDEDAHRELQALAHFMPEPGGLWIVGADGTVRLSSASFPAVNLNVSDRYYLTAHHEARRDLVIGPLVMAKLRPGLAFHLSQRIDGPGGDLAGIAVANFQAESFTDFEQPLPLGRNAAITMADMQGRVILRQPWHPQWAGGSIAGSVVMAAVARGETSGTLINRSPLDGVERLIAYRAIPEFGVVVLAGEAMADVLAPWHRVVWNVAGTVVVLALLLGVLARFTFRSLGREERLVGNLGELVRERTLEAEARAEEARLANESKTRFLATASHDLRQPLQAAGMFIEALSVRLDGSPHANIVEKVRLSVDATNALLTTLLDVSTLEAGKVAANIARFPLMPMMASLYDQVEAEASAKGLELRVVPTDLAVVSDPVLLERILRNLMLNATRYTQSGKVLLGCRRRGDKVAICVVDTGIGIPADKLDEVFDDFTRLGDKGSGFQRGLGLGLGVVRRTAQLLDHPVELRSVEGKGSCFAVLVPRG